MTMLNSYIDDWFASRNSLETRCLGGKWQQVIMMFKLSEVREHESYDLEKQKKELFSNRFVLQKGSLR